MVAGVDVTVTVQSIAHFLNSEQVNAHHDDGAASRASFDSRIPDTAGFLFDMPPFAEPWWDPCQGFYKHQFLSWVGALYSTEPAIRDAALHWLSVFLKLCPSLRDLAEKIRTTTADGNTRTGLTQVLEAPWPCRSAVLKLREILRNFKRSSATAHGGLSDEEIDAAKAAMDTLLSWKCWGYRGFYRRLWTDRLDSFRSDLGAARSNRGGPAFTPNQLSDLIEFIEKETAGVSGYATGDE